MNLSTLYRDEHYLVVDKPAGIATTQPDGRASLTAEARRYDGTAARMHPSSRLDAEVSGIVIFARTTEAIRTLLRARREHAYHRMYVGLGVGVPSPAEGQWSASIGIDPVDPRKRVALDETAVEAHEAAPTAPRRAQTRYHLLAAANGLCALALWPVTGRTHQLRVHAAHAGVPLLGDRLYCPHARMTLTNGRVIAPSRAMLHCAHVVVPKPGGRGALAIASAPPGEMQHVWERAGGQPTLGELLRPHERGEL